VVVDLAAVTMPLALGPKRVLSGVKACWLLDVVAERPWRTLVKLTLFAGCAVIRCWSCGSATFEATS
jgi:hypothetical protein